MTRLTLVLVCTVQFLQAGKPPEVSDSLRFSVPAAPRISPDGSLVVWQASRTNWDENTFESDLWIARTAPPFEPRRLASTGWNGDAQWSADGKRLAFISDRSGRRQVFVSSPVSLETRKLTSLDSGVNEFRWAPDGQSIVLTPDDDDRAVDFEVVNSSRSPRHLWRIGVEPGSKPLEIAPDKDYSVGGFAWSPDGSKIAFQSDAIYTLDLATGSIRKLASGAGPYRDPVWSPAGDFIAFETAAGNPGFYYSNWRVARVSIVGGDPEVLTPSFDENADLVAWTPAGIYFGALQRTESHLFLLNPATGSVTPAAGAPEAVASQFSVAAKGDSFAYIAASPTALPEVMVSGGLRITSATEQLRGFDLATREVVRWQTPGGVQLEGILLKPTDFDPARKYPLLVDIHGGPVAVDQAVVRPDRTYPLEQFVAKGALVLRPNYRGSAGYGEKLRALAVRTLGTGDASDILAGVDSLIAAGFVDPDRVGAMGWSEGGYVAAFLGTYTDRFRAVSVGAGVSDWMTYYVNTDITPFTRQYLKATPWDDPEIYRVSSPISYVNRAKTPMLIQHGDQDRRVPIPNAYELRQALEDRNVPVKMIVYKGFGHSIDRPRQQRAAMQHNLDWFSEWILDAKAPARPAPPQSLTRAASETAAEGLQ